MNVRIMSTNLTGGGLYEPTRIEMTVEVIPLSHEDCHKVNYLLDIGHRYYSSAEDTQLLRDLLMDRGVPGIKNVYFNDPVTVVLWDDGTKTIVKCQEGDTYSKEVGLALCISKKALGNKGNFNDIFKKWIPEEKEARQCCPKGCATCKFVHNPVCSGPCYSCDLSYSEWTPRK